MKGEKLLEMRYFAHRQAELTAFTIVVEFWTAQKLSSLLVCAATSSWKNVASAGIRQEMSEPVQQSERGSRGENREQNERPIFIFSIVVVFFVFFCSVELHGKIDFSVQS